MGMMKRFGMELARMIHADKWNDERIISHYKKKMPTIDVEWLKDQIKVVRTERNWKSQAYKEV